MPAGKNAGRARSPLGPKAIGTPCRLGRESCKLWPLVLSRFLGADHVQPSRDSPPPAGGAFIAVGLDSGGSLRARSAGAKNRVIGRCLEDRSEDRPQHLWPVL